MPVVHVTVDQLDATASQGQARDHLLVMDRPHAKDGQNKGPMGGEALLMGLGGCFMSNLLAAAKTRNIELSNARVEISGEIADSPPARYTAINMKVRAQCSADQLAKLVTIAERACIVANTLSHALDLTIECVR